MRAIVTRYAGATDKHGSRIIVSAEGVRSKSYSLASIDYRNKDASDAHAAAAARFAAEHDWPGRLIGGGLPDNRGYAFVFADCDCKR